MEHASTNPAAREMEYGSTSPAAREMERKRRRARSMLEKLGYV
jgi:hypothetical protein